jgi:predicted nucleotide-binding protein
MGSGAQLTQYGVEAWDDESTLDYLLPVERAPTTSVRAQHVNHPQGGTMTTQSPDPKKVFIIHGRNVKARKAVEQFVRSLGLTPIDFEQLAADSGAAFIGEIVRNGLAQAQGIIALFTADEIAHLRPDYHEPHDGQEDKERWQSRPNVLFEAGMAYGSAPERTILAVLGGQTKLFSDVRGMHLTYLSNKTDARKRLRQKLIGAKCDVDLRSDAYDDPSVSGDFDSCLLPEVSTRDPFRS